MKFPNEHHLASWSGVSPGKNESAGKKSSRTIHGNKHLQATLIESAWGASRKKEGYFKQKYQKILVRKGSKKAIVAVAHKIIIAAYQVIKKNEVYRSSLLDDTKFSEKQKQKEIQKTIVKMIKLGFKVRITPIK